MLSCRMPQRHSSLYYDLGMLLTFHCSLWSRLDSSVLRWCIACNRSMECKMFFFVCVWSPCRWYCCRYFNNFANVAQSSHGVKQTPWSAVLVCIEHVHGFCADCKQISRPHNENWTGSCGEDASECLRIRFVQIILWKQTQEFRCKNVLFIAQNVQKVRNKLNII